MGDIYIDMTVANLHDMEKNSEINFLVDTGATRAWIRNKDALALGIKPEGEVNVSLADGNIRSYEYGACWFIYEGERVVGNVIIGPDECEPLAGTHLLQDFRLIIDMNTHEIKKSRALKAKKQG